MNRFTKAELVELAYAAANGEEAVGTHAEAMRQVKESEGPRREVEAYRKVLNLVREALADAAPGDGTVGPCLDDEVIAAYIDHELEPRAKSAAEAHLGRCPFCVGQLAGLAELVHETPPVYEARGLTYVLELAERGLRLLSHPQEGFSFLDATPAAVLGADAPVAGEKTCTWRQCLGSCSVLVTVVQTNGNRVDLSLTVSKDSEPLPKSRITLRREEHIVQSEFTAESGRVHLPGLEVGLYECELRLPGDDSKQHFKLDLRAENS